MLTSLDLEGLEGVWDLSPGGTASVTILAFVGFLGMSSGFGVVSEVRLDLEDFLGGPVSVSLSLGFEAFFGGVSDEAEGGDDSE